MTHFSTDGDPHGSAFERWNRTLKTKIFRCFNAKNTLKYIDVLPALVKAYNHSFNSSIKEKPVNVTPKNQLGHLVQIVWETNKSGEKPKC